MGLPEVHNVSGSCRKVGKAEGSERFDSGVEWLGEELLGESADRVVVFGIECLASKAIMC